MKNEAVIRLHAYDPVILTTAEYEQLQAEVRGRIVAGVAGISDRICLRLLEEHASRYHEAKAVNAARAEPKTECVEQLLDAVGKETPPEA